MKKLATRVDGTEEEDRAKIKIQLNPVVDGIHLHGRPSWQSFTETEAGFSRP